MHLFVDSLVNQDKQSFAFQCTDSSRFKKGICLSCRKNRCNGIGYNARRIRHKRNTKMYLKTRADMPFKGTLPLPGGAASQGQCWEGAASPQSCAVAGPAGTRLLCCPGA